MIFKLAPDLYEIWGEDEAVCGCTVAHIVTYVEELTRVFECFACGATWIGPEELTAQDIEWEMEKRLEMQGELN